MKTPEEKRAYFREYRAKNREKTLAAQRKWRAANLEKARKASRDWVSQWRKYNPDEMKATNRYQQLRRYGITQADVDLMIIKQNNRCAICGVEPDRQWHVDHCHTTGRVRGMLCAPCNKGLGHFRDDVETLKNAIQYLVGGRRGRHSEAG